VEQGFGKAKCFFNNTLAMNATVISPTTIYCNSPPYDSQNPEMWYNVSVSLDGEYQSEAGGIFSYYKQPVLSSVIPWTGPLSGGTTTTVSGHGFN